MTDVNTTLLEARAWDGRANDRGIDIIKFCEGWSKVGKPYVCLTGYGSLWGLDGKRVTKTSPALIKKQGEELLRRDLSVAEKAVHALIRPRLTPNQFSA